MATTKLYLDTRHQRADGLYPLKINISNGKSSSQISLNINVAAENWDTKTSKVVKIPMKHILNTTIANRKMEIDNALLSIPVARNLSAKELKTKILAILNPKEVKHPDLFATRFLAFANKKNKRTKEIYMATYHRMEQFDEDLSSLRFEDVGKEWLQRFDAFLAKNAPSINARNIHMRNIRTVFNDAIDDEITFAYPFRKFKIKNTPTRKRSFAVEDLRRIINADAGNLERYKDFFVLSFMLIGINVADLCSLKSITNNRIEYSRAKTHRLYSIKVEPEAMAIFDKYSGGQHLLAYLDNYANYRWFYGNLHKALLKIKEIVGIEDLTTYWARHSWATIAASLDIPKDTIAAALGHGGNTVTDIYIDFDRRKVDDANRKVLDYVLYDKK